MVADEDVTRIRESYRKQIARAGLSLPTPVFVQGQSVTLVDNPKIWSAKFAGHTGIVSFIERSYATGEPDRWLYTVRIDDMPYSMQCGDYALIARQAKE